MTKMVGAAEFKAKCLKLIDEMQADGQPITITRRGKPVAVVSRVSIAGDDPKPLASAFGMLRNDAYRFDLDPEESACDPDWEAQWEAKWDELGFPAPPAER